MHPVVMEPVLFWLVWVESGYCLKIQAGYETGTGNTTLTRSVLTMHCVCSSVYLLRHNKSGEYKKPYASFLGQGGF